MLLHSKKVLFTDTVYLVLILTALLYTDDTYCLTIHTLLYLGLLRRVIVVLTW